MFKFPAFSPCEVENDVGRPDFVFVDFKTLSVPADNGVERLVSVSSPLVNPNKDLDYRDFNVEALTASGMMDKMPSFGSIPLDPLRVADSIMSLPRDIFDLIDSSQVASASASAAAPAASPDPKVTENNVV